ncbi:MAG: Rrf2 family transcriptional regulator [Micrococcus sp.]|nr:Rrf2 family transcriptional regulator [Micrococcus sp.]
MKLNAFTDVCLRILMTLGRDPERKLTSQDIADEIAVPYNHVIKAVGELRRRGALTVTRGRTGGARITDHGLHLRVGGLVRDLSTRDEVIDCEGKESGTPCPLVGNCALRGALARAREAFLAELDAITLAELLPPLSEATGPVSLGLPPVGAPAV